MSRAARPPKPRNAYAVPAKRRRNAGPMTHRSPPREKPPEPRSCERCGAPLDEGDPEPLCPECSGTGE